LPPSVTSRPPGAGTARGPACASPVPTAPPQPRPDSATEYLTIGQPAGVTGRLPFKDERQTPIHEGAAMVAQMDSGHTLVVLRHAKAAGEPGVNDLERPLYGRRSGGSGAGAPDD